MSVFSNSVRRIRNALRHQPYSARIAYQNRDYYLNSHAKKQSSLPTPNHSNIIRAFEERGITVIPYKIDLDGFYGWLEEARFPLDYINHGEVFVEKALEHYVGASLLQMKSEDIFIDVAAASSPWYEIAERLYGCNAYALDLAFPSGVHDKKIGSDATHMPLSDESATKIALHCAYELFEGTADIRLLSEAYRVLRRGGKMVILPLYMDEFYYALSSPYTDTRGLDYGGAELVWREDPHRVRFARRYSVKAFFERIITNLGRFTLKIYCIQNENEVSPECYLKYAALFEKPYSIEPA